MGGGMSSRLFQEAREKRGLCYTIFAQAAAYADAGTLMIYSGTSGADVAGLSELIIDELRRAGDGLSHREVARARTQMRAGLLMGLESSSARCERLARMIAIWGRIVPIEEGLAKLDAVTPESVQAYSQTLAQKGAAMALYGPVEGAPSLEVLTDRLAA
jgi:predicted Zn-dependent peptidase